jgi:hypothetical protein
MKQAKKGQQGQKTKAGENRNQGKAGDTPSKRDRKNEDVSSGDTKEEPTTPSTPGTPNTPTPPPPTRREYEDPGHEHTYNPPTANPSSAESMRGFVGE